MCSICAVVVVVVAIFVGFVVKIPSQELAPLMLDSVPDVVKRLRPHVESELEWSCRISRRVWLPELLLNRVSLASGEPFSPQALNETLALLLSDGTLEQAPDSFWPWPSYGYARSTPCGTTLNCRLFRALLASTLALLVLLVIFRQYALRRDSRFLAAQILAVLKEEAAGTRRLDADRRPLAVVGVAKVRLREELLEEFGMKGWFSDGRAKWDFAETIISKDRRIRSFEKLEYGEQTSWWHLLPSGTGVVVGGEKKKAGGSGLQLSDYLHVLKPILWTGGPLGAVWYLFIM